MDYLPWVSLGASLTVGVAVGYLWYEIGKMKMTVRNSIFLLSKRVDLVEEEMNGIDYDS